MTDQEILEIIAQGIVDGTDMDCTTMDQARAVLKALRDEGVLQEWLQIETAPKDGTRILAIWPSLDGFMDNPSEIRTWWSDSAERWENPYESSDCTPPPTHWMPLPEPPQ